MASSFSVGDSFDDHLFPSHRFHSPLWSNFPTGILRSKSSWVSAGGFSLSILFDSYLSSSLSEVHHLPKPPWKLLYIPITIFLSLLHFPIRLFPFSIHQIFPMSDFLRKSVQDLDLGIDDVPVALPSEFCSQAASITRFSLVVTTLNQRKQNLRALFGQMPRVWSFPNSCVGRIMGHGRVQFRFQSEESMNLVFRRGPWSFSDWMFSTNRWYPNITEEEMKIIPWMQIEEASTIITLWTRIYGTLTLYLTNDMVKFAGFEIGLIIAVGFEATVHSTSFVSVQMLWISDKDLLLKQKSKYSSALMEFTLFGRLENVLVTLRWILLVIRGLGLWDDMVDLFVATFKRITQVHFFKETVVRKCWCHYVYIPELAWDTLALMLRFVKGGHSQKLLSTIRNKEKSNMKLDNNRFFDRLASKATLRKASSNSLLLYFLLVYGTYICVCNNCISLILYVFVKTLLV